LGRRDLLATHMIRYTVKPEQAAPNQELLRAIIAELEAVQPDGVSHAALKLDDGVTFIHVVSHDKDVGALPGRELEALRAFHEGLRERCAEPPTRTAVTVVGSYGTFDPKRR